MVGLRPAQLRPHEQKKRPRSTEREIDRGIEVEIGGLSQMSRSASHGER